MDTIGTATSILAMQQGNLQGQIATTLTKQNLDAEKFAVQTLLGTGAPLSANLGPGIGENLNVTA